MDGGEESGGGMRIFYFSSERGRQSPRTEGGRDLVQEHRFLRIRCAIVDLRCELFNVALHGFLLLLAQVNVLNELLDLTV